MNGYGDGYTGDGNGNGRGCGYGYSPGDGYNHYQGNGHGYMRRDDSCCSILVACHYLILRAGSSTG